MFFRFPLKARGGVFNLGHLVNPNHWDVNYFSPIDVTAIQHKSHYNYRDVKSPPPKKWPFFGGVCFCRLKSWIFEFGGQKNFWWQKSLDRTVRPIFSRPSAIFGYQINFKISTISKISVFDGKFCDVFFSSKLRFSSKFPSKTLKMVFLRFFRPRR